MKCNLLLVFILFFTMQSIGQQLRLRSSKTNLPVENASLLNVRSGVVDYTDKEGVAELSNFLEGDDILVSSVGYFDMTIRWVQFNKQADKTFYIIEQVVPVPTAVITEFGRQELLSEVPRQVDVIGVDQLRFLNPQTSADVLEGSGKVLVQKSQQGGGSPIIRGFEANKILLVVDGVRMNNAIYRAGHLQNAITVDHNILEQVEVSFGPGSVVYGSDALGGVIHYRTRTPQLSESGKQEVKVNLNGRLGTANQEKLIHLDFSIAEGKVASLTSISRSDFGDLRMGSNRPHGDSLWGLVPEYVSSIGTEDLVLENPDPEIQKGTAYSQIDFLQKFVYQPVDSLQLIANFQFSNSSNIPRFDNLNDYRNGTLRWAEWSYGPQKRVLTSLAIKHSEKTGFYDEFNAVAAYQFIEESRYKRRLNSTTRNSQVEQVDVMSVNLDFLKKVRSQTRFNYGLEIVRNEVNSEANDRD
ncbi:MAG: TonB-dependent receptor plug domain-containing protein, partial [Flavobacteriales bacterium]